MNVDLPPLSAFTPDPAVARATTMRDTLTLALQAAQGPVHIEHEIMSGTVSTGPTFASGSDGYRAGIGLAEDLTLTITF